jgi:hypothetical protein
MVDYNIAAIPTVYNGRQYRSRLEAKWAAFFELCDWPVEYEPVDLGDWSPDFSIKGAHGPILVEIKPIQSPDKETITKMHQAAMKADFAGEMLLLGVAPFDGYLGWLDDNTGCDDDGHRFVPWFDEAPFAWYAAKPHQIDFCHSLNGFGGRITGLYDGGSWGSARHPGVKSEKDLWAAASNAVQWQAKRSVG